MDLSNFDWKGAVAGIAPLLGGALGGPAGSLAAGALARALLPADKQANPTDADLAQAVASLQPADYEKLKEAEYQFKLDMQKITNDFALQQGAQGVQLEQIAANDRDSARKREQAVKDLTPMVLAIAVTVGFFSILFYMLINGVPDKGHDVLMVLLGALSTAFATVLAYYFGSSAGSARKTEMLKMPAPAGT